MIYIHTDTMKVLLMQYEMQFNNILKSGNSIPVEKEELNYDNGFEIFDRYFEGKKVTVWGRKLWTILL